MRETKLWAKLRPHLLIWGECDRVENSVGSGMSDVFYNIGGKTGWIETKVAKGDLVYFEKFQPGWIAKHDRLGARMFVVVMDKYETIHLFYAAEVLKAPRTPKEGWVTVNMHDLTPKLSMPKPYRHWDAVRKILTS